MGEEKRKTGIDIIGEAPWGTHLCLFYQKKEDLIDILVPYFKAGLENNEFCMWVTSEPLKVQDVKKALKKAVKNLDGYIKKGQLEILDYSQWYSKSGKFDADKVLEGWVKKEKQAVKRGFDGLRLTGNTFWLDKSHWRKFADYEATENKVIGNYRMLAICTYSLDKCRAPEIMDILSNHQFALIKKAGKWISIESSERKKAEEKIKKEKEFVSSLLLRLKEGFAAVDREGRQILVNDELCKMTGYTKEELLNQKPPFKYWAEENLEDINEAFEKTLKGVEGEYELTFKRKNGERSLALVSPRKIIDPYGDTIFFATVKDITKHKKAEEMLRKDKDYLEKLHNSIGDAIFTVKIPERVIEFANSSVKNIFGYKAEESIGKKTEIFYPNKEGYLEFGKKLKRAIEQGKDMIHTEQLLRRKNGEIFPAEIKTFFLRVNREIQAISIISDVTERKKTERALQEAYQKLKETQEQLIQSGKMAAMGQLAVGVSHELNQPLTGIKGFTQAAIMDLEENNPLRGDLNKIIEQADRMDKIIQHVRLFARKSEFTMKELDAKQPIEDALILLNKQLRVHNIQVKKFLSKNLPKIQGDPNQLEQVFLNLITNARDAIDSLNNPNGGELSVKTSLSKDKKNIEITFEDAGVGIPRENLGNIFNPFFTTKSPDGGIGLGLSIAYRIIENHKGKINVKSEEGKGATFKIMLPISCKD